MSATSWEAATIFRAFSSARSPSGALYAARTARGEIAARSRACRSCNETGFAVGSRRKQVDKVGFQRCAAIVDNVSGQVTKFVDMNGARTKAAGSVNRMDCSRKVSASVEKRHDIERRDSLRESEAVDLTCSPPKLVSNCSMVRAMRILQETRKRDDLLQNSKQFKL